MKDKNKIINLARKFASGGKIDEAIAELSTLIKDNRDGNIHNTIGDLHLKKMAKDDAINSYSEAAGIFREEGFYTKAIALYKKILNISPDKLSARITVAELNADRGFAGQAVDDLRNIADKLCRDGSNESAINVYEKILRFTPDDITVHLNIAELSVKTGNVERAMKGFLFAAANSIEKDDNVRAEQIYLKVLEIAPENVDALVGLGRLMEKEYKIDKAVEYLSRAASLAPDDKKLLLYFADLAIKVDRREEAINALEIVKEAFPSDSSVRKNLGLLYIENEPDRAWEELEPCIDEVIADNNYAEAEAMLTNFEQFKSLTIRDRFIKLYRKNGDNESLFRELNTQADLYREQGSDEKAFEMLTEALELSPDDETIKSRIEELREVLGITPPEESDSEGSDIQVEVPVSEPDGRSEHEDLHQYAEAKKAEAESYAEMGETARAISIYEELLLTYPGDAELEDSLNALKAGIGATGLEGVGAGEETFQIETSNEMIDTINDVMQDTSSSVDEDFEAHFRAGMDFRRAGNIEGAIEALRLASGDGENLLRNSRMLALCYIERGSFPSAIEEFKKVLENMDPEDAGYLDIMYEMAEAYIKNNDIESAVAAFEGINERDPAFREVAHKLETLRPHIVTKTPVAGPVKQSKSRIAYL